MEKFGPFQPESDDDEQSKAKKDEKSKKPEKRGKREEREQREKRFGSSILGAERREEPSKQVPGPLGELLGLKQHEVTQEEHAAKAEAAKEAAEDSAVSAEAETGEEATKLETAAESSAATTTEAANEKPEPYKPPEREISITHGEISLGEGIHQQSDPIEELILLHADQHHEKPAESERLEPAPLQMQPEIQHQGKDQEAAEPEEPEESAPETAATAEDGNETVPAAAEEPAEPAKEPTPTFEWLSSLGHPEGPGDADPRPEPAQVYRAYMQQQAAQQTVVHQSAPPQSGFPLAEATPITQEELDDRVHSASKYYQRKGLLTGLLVGGWYEHRKHKRREKKAARQAKAKDKQLEAARKDYSFGLQEQERQRAELNARLNVAEGRVTVAEQIKSQEALARAAAKPEQPVAAGEQFAIPPEHRIELSTWLSTEIDKRTGRAVERPTFQYGHEYYRERAQEGVPIHQRNAAAGAAALMAANGQTPADGTSLPPTDLPSATMQGRPSQAGSQQANGTQRKASEPIASAALLWPWVLALIIIVVCLAVALH